MDCEARYNIQQNQMTRERSCAVFYGCSVLGTGSASKLEAPRAIDYGSISRIVVTSLFSAIYGTLGLESCIGLAITNHSLVYATGNDVALSYLLCKACSILWLEVTCGWKSHVAHMEMLRVG